MSGSLDGAERIPADAIDVRGEPHPMGAAARARWSSVVRQDAVDAVAAQLGSGVVEGVVISGGAGTGKTTLARAVERRLVRKNRTLHLYGKVASAAVPFGQLDFLLARLAPEAMASPGAIVSAISELIRTDAAGKPTLVVVDDLPAMDDMSTAVLMHLMLGGHAKVLVLVRQLGDLPEDLAWRLKDHMMAHVHLPDFSRPEVLELLTGTLGHTVSATAVSGLHAASHGNPLVLQAMVTEQLRSDNLHLNENVWALRGPVTVASADALAELVQARLAREPAGVREALEEMAILRRSPLAVLADLWGPEMMAWLEESGYLAIERNDRRWVSLADDYLGTVLLGWMDETRRRALHRRISAMVGPDPGSLAMEDLLTFALWTIDGGGPLDPAVALEAARLALGLFDPSLALRCAGTITPADPQWVAACQQRSWAHLVLADPRAALAALREASAEQLAAVSAVDYGAYMVQLCRVLLYLPEGTGLIEQALAGAEEAMAARAGDGGDLRDGADQLKLAGYALKVHQGEFAEVVDGLEKAYLSGTDHGFRLNCGALLSVAWAMTGRELDAVTLSLDVAAEADAAGIALSMRAECREGLYLGRLFSGDWRACTSALRQVLDEVPGAMRYGGGAAELALGVGYLYAGHGKLALGLLHGAKAQLDVRDNLPDSAFADSALAFAYAQLGDAAAARRHLDLAAECSPPREWVVRSMAEFCNLMARRWLQEPGAKQKLIESARVDLAKGRITAASTSLFGATVHGTDEEFALLEEISARRQGGMARINVLMASGSRTKNAATLLEAADAARALGLDAVESRALVLATDIDRGVHPGAGWREAQARLEELAATLPLLPLAPHTHGPELTGRERQIAKMAGEGLSNRDIAAALDVSVRTIEGHLYQIFTKLGISSRSDIDGPQRF
ncbi:LuxR C-terminal-related transcriptional regulator [Pseudarthrobacter sp. P1]|uniref:helix-turn-helix transcriptional regulator n=1 Tax=Pseudarthrobacter sp. P1 TaxID=3418418 RepID=UPI003CE7055E